MLWLADWSAFCRSCLAGGKTADEDMKAIGAAHSLFVASLHALAPALMRGVLVLKQSDVILSNPSDYWIAVINAGRSFALSSLRDAHRSLEGLPPQLEARLKAMVASVEAAADGKGAAAALGAAIEPLLADAECTRRISPSEIERVLRPAAQKAAEGAPSLADVVTIAKRAADGCLDLGFSANHVLSMLMHIADVLALNPATICASGAAAPLHRLATKYMSEAAAVQSAGLSPPAIHELPPVSLRLKVPTADATADAADADAELSLLDATADVQRKVKSAFCEPPTFHGLPWPSTALH